MASENPPSTACLLDRLPDELWLEILSYLDYFDLHRVRRVCKRMDGWTKQSSLDVTLFRRPLSPTPLAEGTKVVLHPIFSRIKYMGYDSLEAAFTVERDFRSLSGFPFLDEWATQPACRSIRCGMSPSDGATIRVEDHKGLEVSRLLEGVQRYWMSDSRWMAYEFGYGEVNEDGELEDEDALEYGTSVYMTNLEWDRWSDGIVEADGTVSVEQLAAGYGR